MEPPVITPNTTLATLRQGRLALGIILRLALSVEMPRIAKACDHDFIFIDMQHGGMAVETSAAVCQAALDTGVTPLVRVPGLGPLAARLLDSGAMGIIFPDIETVEQARAAVDLCRFSPLGRRSVAGGYPQLRYHPYPTAEATRIMNEQTLVVAMIESGRGVENAAAIAAVPGIDVLHIGSNDLLNEMGILHEMGRERHFALAARVQEACHAHGKAFGIGGVRVPALQERFIAMGARFLTTNTDLAFLMAAAGDSARGLRALATPSR